MSPFRMKPNPAEILRAVGISGTVVVQGKRNRAATEACDATLCAVSARALVKKGWAAWTEDRRGIEQTAEGHKALWKAP